MARKRSWTDEEFTHLVRASFSIREVLRKLGLRETGGNYKEFRRHCRRLELSTDHFHGRGHLRGKVRTWGRNIPLDQVLVENSSYTNMHSLKKRLIAEGVLEACCSECGLREWRGKPLALELDHRNGVHHDHRRENIRLLCPNCHSQTETYRGRNKGTYPRPTLEASSAVHNGVDRSAQGGTPPA